MGNNNIIMNIEIGRMRNESIVAYFKAASQNLSKIIVSAMDVLHFLFQLFCTFHRFFDKSVSLTFVTEADPCLSVAQNVHKRRLCFT
jgi:hypothetical protein